MVSFGCLPAPSSCGDRLGRASVGSRAGWSRLGSVGGCGQRRGTLRARGAASSRTTRSSRPGAIPPPSDSCKSRTPCPSRGRGSCRCTPACRRYAPVVRRVRSVERLEVSGAPPCSARPRVIEQLGLRWSSATLVSAPSSARRLLRSVQYPSVFRDLRESFPRP